jgi:radical SAM protein with 4Fe4S-binding SPASM domain
MNGRPAARETRLGGGYAWAVNVWRARAGVYWRLFRSALQNPRYYWFVTRSDAWSDMTDRLRSGERPESRTFYPTKLDLRIVYGCNLRCKMCGQWGDTGTFFDYDKTRLGAQLSVEVIERVVDELIPHGLRYVDMEGGETFLYPQIMDLLRKLKSRGLFVKPVTNGTRLERFAEEIVDSRIDAIHVSMDGDREAHNHVRQASWAYDKTLEGLAALMEARKRAGRRVPLVQINFTVTRHNGADSLRRLCDDLAGRGLVDVLSVKRSPIWMPEQAGLDYVDLLDRTFGIHEGVESWKGFVEDYSDFGEEAKRVAATVRELQSRGYDFLIDGLPGIPDADLPRMFTDYDWNLGRSHCPIPFIEPTIEADGNVYPCNLFTDEPLSMGNVNEQPFLDIWFGEKYEAFRKMLAEQGGLMPVCNRCCQLTEI